MAKWVSTTYDGMRIDHAGGLQPREIAKSVFDQPVHLTRLRTPMTFGSPRGVFFESEISGKKVFLRLSASRTFEDLKRLWGLRIRVHERPLAFIHLRDFAGQGHLVTRFVGGTELSDIIKGKNYPFSGKIRALKAAARSLAALHSASFAHGYLDPENILIAGNRARLLSPNTLHRVVGKPPKSADNFPRALRHMAADALGSSRESRVILPELDHVVKEIEAEYARSLARIRIRLKKKL